MSNFKLSDQVNKDKVFLMNRAEIEQRLDPFYYIPSITKLEKVVQTYKPQPLANYVVNIASGATPKTSGGEKYYTDKEKGVPFLRVQNLSPTGHLQLDDCKYINQITHEGMLKRSQVAEGDLLVKITGVGRMAIASVAPKGFVGNSNQHLVVIKTKSKEVSEILAAYLNTDIAEKLASRRATGGTRPALDYPALLSIPIIFDKKILDITQKAVQLKQQKLDQAQQLLAGINDYLLKELGIVLPQKDTSLQSRIFQVPMREVSGGRFDAEYFQPYYTLFEQTITTLPYSLMKLSTFICFIESGSRPKGGVNDINKGVFSIGGEHVGSDCEVGIGKPKYVTKEFHEKIKHTETVMNDIVLVKDGATTGKIGIITSQKLVGQNINEHVFLIRLDETMINPFYFTFFFHSLLGQILLKREITGATVTGLTKEALQNIVIPLPNLAKQNEIVAHIQSLREQAKLLEIEANQLLTQANQAVEQLILGQAQ